MATIRELEGVGLHQGVREDLTSGSPVKFRIVRDPLRVGKRHTTIRSERLPRLYDEDVFRFERCD